MTTCSGGGFLVDGTHIPPEDPTDLDVEGLPVVGCSRLRCRRCGQPVRSAAGLSFATRADVPLAQVYATPDLASSPLLHRERPEWRLYLCRCARWLETSQHACVIENRDDSDPDVPWRCEGHPSISLPFDLDGSRVATQVELRDLVVRGFQGDAPPRTRTSDKVRAEWIARLHWRLNAKDAPVVVSAALFALEDPAPRARAFGLRFFYLVPSEQGRARVLELLERRRELFAGVPDPVTTIEVDGTLEHTAWRVVAPLVAVPGPARERARAEALAGRANVAIYDVLAQHDSGWVTSHGVEIAKAAPHRVSELLDSFSQFPDGVPARPLREKIRAALARS